MKLLFETGPRTVLLAALLLLATPAVLAQSDATDRTAILDILENGPVAIGPGTENWEVNFHPDWTVWFAGGDAVRERGPHMADVRDYVGRGADVVEFELDLVSLQIRGDTAFARYNAVEHIIEGDGGRRDVAYSGTDWLVREDGRWLILSTTVAFPERDMAD